MDNFDDLQAVNLDDDRDLDCSVSSDDESDRIDKSGLCDQNDSARMDASDGKFKKIVDLTADEIRGLEFGSDEEAYDFYCNYARCHGFGVRKDEVINRKKDHRSSSRTNCQARFRVCYKLKASRWEVRCFEEVHNHELTPSHLVACCGMKDADKISG